MRFEGVGIEEVIKEAPQGQMEGLRGHQSHQSGEGNGEY